MEVYCTRPYCQRPKNFFPDLDDITTLKTVSQKFCTDCGMPLILRDRYLPIKLLAIGGFGNAFLAIDRDSPKIKKCVVKQFQPSHNLTAEALEKAKILFTQEAGVLEEIGNEHPQIPNLFAFFPVTVPSLQINQSEQFFYLVQEYIEGQTLEEELNAQGKFSEQKIIEILQEILPLLQFIHNKDIIHRDIKPANIMRRDDGRLFLLDFGAVKLITNASSSSTGIYSLGFAPLEQMKGSQVFPSTDLYALAVTVITLLTGQEANQLFDTYTNQWQWRSQITVNPQLADVLDKMLLPAASQRFRSAQEVLEALFPASVAPTVLPSTQPPHLQPPQLITSIQPVFTTWEVLTGAAFSGFEGALIAIAFLGIFKNPIIAIAISMVILSWLIFAQTQRRLKQSHLLIIASVSLAIIFFVPYLRNSYAIQQIIILSLAAALISIAVTTLFRLIYKLLSAIL
ncbi:serine/threonine-protein kinase [Dolichospermum sp. UHCC 0259]|uniref:serine/threonine-protein kinase n=1 Tax=Dolichospermum sp. UHCC 0259 TaxID=2590010 RepID=UPI001445CF1F|nr:serine/threonine-protein kinase [Dolichospermum sp. UHCC 0259]MTJ47897.1 serine/threonine protein kinase [Dolichospermum sp. UHCC 0259]